MTKAVCSIRHKAPSDQLTPYHCLQQTNLARLIELFLQRWIQKLLAKKVKLSTTEYERSIIHAFSWGPSCWYVITFLTVLIVIFASLD